MKLVTAFNSENNASFFVVVSRRCNDTTSIYILWL